MDPWDQKLQKYNKVAITSILKVSLEVVKRNRKEGKMFRGKWVRKFGEKFTDFLLLYFSSFFSLSTGNQTGESFPFLLHNFQTHLNEKNRKPLNINLKRK